MTPVCGYEKTAYLGIPGTPGWSPISRTDSFKTTHYERRRCGWRTYCLPHRTPQPRRPRWQPWRRWSRVGQGLPPHWPVSPVHHPSCLSPWWRCVECQKWPSSAGDARFVRGSDLAARGDIIERKKTIRLFFANFLITPTEIDSLKNAFFPSLLCRNNFF